MVDVKQNISFLVEMSELRQGQDKLDQTVVSLAKLWTQSAACMTQLINGNQKLRAVTVASISSHLKSQGLNLVTHVVSTRKKLLGFVNEIEALSQKGMNTLKKDIMLADDDLGASLSEDVMASESGIKDFLTMTIPPPVLTEMNNQDFDDVVSCKAAELLNKVKDIQAAFEKSCEDHNTAKNLSGNPFHDLKCGKAWQNLPEEPSGQDFLRASQETIIPMLPARGMKDLVVNGNEAC